MRSVVFSIALRVVLCLSLLVPLVGSGPGGAGLAEVAAAGPEGGILEGLFDSRGGFLSSANGDFVLQAGPGVFTEPMWVSVHLGLGGYAGALRSFELYARTDLNPAVTLLEGPLELTMLFPRPGIAAPRPNLWRWDGTAWRPAGTAVQIDPGLGLLTARIQQTGSYAVGPDPALGPPATPTPTTTPTPTATASPTPSPSPTPTRRPTATPTPTVTPTPTATPSTAMVGPGGGVLHSGDGRVSVVFPPRAVTQQVRVEYRRLRPQPRHLATFDLRAGLAATGQPVLQFGRPVSLAVGYRAEELSGGDPARRQTRVGLQAATEELWPCASVRTAARRFGRLGMREWQARCRLAHCCSARCSPAAQARPTGARRPVPMPSSPTPRPTTPLSPTATAAPTPGPHPTPRRL